MTDMIKMVHYKETLEKIKKAHPPVYEVSFQEDVEPAKSDLVHIDDKITFLMSQGRSLIQENWHDLIAQKTVLGEEQLRFSCRAASDRACPKEKERYEKEQVCALLTCGYHLKQGDVIRLRVPKNLPQGMKALKFNLMSENEEKWIASHFAGKLEIRTRSDNEIWTEFNVQGDLAKAAVALYLEKENKVKVLGSWYQLTEMYLWPKGRACLINGRAYAFAGLTPSLNRLLIDAAGALKETVGLSKECITAGTDSGYVFFKPFCFPESIQSLQLVTVTNGAVSFEQFDEEQQKWCAVSGRKPLCLHGHQILLRAKMTTGQKICSMLFCKQD